MATADEEKYAVITELKSKYDRNNSKLKQLEAQRRHNEVNLRRSAFTAAHLDELPETVPTYTSVGKAYVLEPKAAVMAHLQEVVESASRELKSAAAAKDNIVQSQEGLTRELNELLTSLNMARKS